MKGSPLGLMNSLNFPYYWFGRTVRTTLQIKIFPWPVDPPVEQIRQMPGLNS